MQIIRKALAPRLVLPTAITVGYALVVVGVALVSLPGALCFAGVALIVAAIVAAIVRGDAA